MGHRGTPGGGQAYQGAAAQPGPSQAAFDGTQPLYLGQGEDAVFAWLHRPASGRAAAGIGVVLCGSFGREEISMHRSLRAFAQALAEAGIPALRFDYAGCGNSAGPQADGSARPADWVRSIHTAADGLKQVTGVPRLCLVGVRLGALLAAQAAQARSDVADFIAVAPVQRGRTFVRELTALHAAWAASYGDPQAGPSELAQSGGFVLSPETVDELGAMDASSLPRPPAPRALLIDRDDLPGADKWAAALGAQGVAAELRVLPGYLGMVENPHRTVVPPAIAAAIVERVQAAAADAAPVAPSAGPHAAATQAQRLVLPGTGVVEQAVRIPGTPLFGVLSLPPVGTPAPRLAVLLLNAGAVRHIGPGRLHVDQARRWARQGLAVLRLDVGGIGDSPPREGQPDNVVYGPQAEADVAAAIAWLRQHGGAPRCIGMGICSGAYHLFKAAASRSGLQAAVLINPLTFFWKEGMSLDAPMAAHVVAAEASRYRRSLFDLGKWKRLAGGKINARKVVGVLLRAAAGPAQRIARTAARALGLPLKDDLPTELKAAARAATRLHFVFSRSDPGHALLDGQGGAQVGKLREQGWLDISFIEGADHMFIDYRARARLAARLDELVEQESTAAPAPAPATAAGGEVNPSGAC